MIIPKNPIRKECRFIWKWRENLTGLSTVEIVSFCFRLLEIVGPNYITYEHIMDMEYKMAKQFEWDFADLSVSKDSLPEIEEFAEAHEHDLSMMYDVMVDDKLKGSLTYSEKQSAWIFTLTVLEDSPIGKNISMTTWGDNPIEVQWVAFFKHIKINERKKWIPTSESQNWG